MHEIAHRWISRYDRARVQALADLKLALEETPMDAPTFVYTTYIRTTPQKLWQALTEPAFTRRYWATEFTTDWSVGSPMTWDNHGVLISDPEQVVLEAEPYSRLSYTWHAITPSSPSASAGTRSCSPGCPARPARRSPSRLRRPRRS